MAQRQGARLRGGCRTRARGERTHCDDGAARHTARPHAGTDHQVSMTRRPSGTRPARRKTQLKNGDARGGSAR
jgi:hypothetical protein